MSRVLSNNIVLQYAVEATIGVLPGAPEWRLLEPNSLSAYGASITTVSRRPISQQRGRKKGTVVNLESAVEFDADLTMQSFMEHIEGFVFAEYANVEFDLKDDTGTVPPPATANEFVVDAASALLAGKVQWVTLKQATLVYGKGYALAANNGLKVLTADLAPSGEAITVAGTAVEDPAPTEASLQVCGIRVTDSDLTFTKTGSLATLVSGADITNWATLGILPGQYVHIGSPVDLTNVLQNALKASASEDTYGYARVVSIAGDTLNLDKLDANLGASADNSGEGVCDILFGRFLRNVSVTANTDDDRYLERSYQFEAVYPDLDSIGTPEYEYAIGNFANELSMSLPLNDKATATWGFIGTNADDFTTSRKTAASSGISVLRSVAINTASNIISLTTDLISAVSDVCFKDLNFTIRNNVTPENCLGTFGASFVNAGLFEVNLEGQMLFTTSQIVDAIKANTTVTFAAILANDDGAIAIDLPSLTFGGGDREFPVDQSVLINLTGESFNDPVGTIPNVSLGISLFPTVPLA